MSDSGRAQLDLWKAELKRRWRRYNAKAVDQLLEQVAASFDELSRERAELVGEVARLRTELAETTRRVDDLTAQVEASKEPTEAERARLEQEVERLAALQSELHTGYRAFLLAALELLESSEPEPREPAEQAGSREA